MRRFASGSMLGIALLGLSATATSAEQLTVNSILTSHKSGAPTGGIVAMVNDPQNSFAMTAADIVTLRDEGVPEAVIAAAYARLPAPTPTPVPLVPDDTRLVDLVRLVKSGISASIIAEQVRQSGEVYNLSVNDLLYLKQNGGPELTIAALMATSGGDSGVAGTAGAPAAPGEVAFNGLWLKAPFMRKNRPGSLMMRGDTFAWVDSRDPRKNFSFQITGVEKVWLSCQARTPENFCYQINFQIVKGDRYRFQDVNRETGSNAAVLEVMDALRTYFPRLSFGVPDNG